MPSLFVKTGSKRCSQWSTVRALRQVGESLGSFKKVSPEDLKAIKHRFLEMYV
jgi:hypothetical protein